jgi:hypothetical protein
MDFTLLHEVLTSWENKHCISDFGSAEDVQKSIEAFFNEYISKKESRPISPALNFKVQQFYDNKRSLLPLENCVVTQETENTLEGPDSPMRCDIKNIQREENYDDPDTGKKAYELFLDFSPYEEFNKSVAKPNFWDKEGKPTLTWFESNFYPRNRGIYSHGG